MKYLKYCESEIIGSGDVYVEQQFIGKIEGQPKQGPTVICFKNPTTEETRIAYTGKNIFSEAESPIQYTWRYEYYNGHPAIIVNFSRIDPGYEENIVCLESNNMARGSGNAVSIMPPNKYNLKGENNNRALNVFSNEYNNTIGDTLNATWYRLRGIKLNRDYPIYITVLKRYIYGASRMHNGNIPNDWEVRINVRPTIRGSFSNKQPTISNTFTFRHTPNIPAKEYISVKFPYSDIFQI